MRPFGSTGLGLAVVVACMLGGGDSATGQDKLPPRVLRPEIDTNSAVAYFQYGMQRLRRDPGEAADAFFWAERLEPEATGPLLARRVALLIRKRGVLVDYIEGHKGVHEKKDVIEADSLRFLAMLRDPYAFSGVDSVLLQEYAAELGVAHGQLVSARSPLGIRAWYAYTSQNFAISAGLYGALITVDTVSSELHFDLAESLFHMDRFADAAAEVRRGLAMQQAHEATRTIIFYRSKSMEDYALGVALALANQPDSARAAYQAALTEDLSFYQAHVGLSELARDAGDQKAELDELAQAEAMAENDVRMRMRYGTALYEADRLDEALVQFRAAKALDPDYSLPYLREAQTLESTGHVGDAIIAYQQFIAHLARSNTHDVDVVTRHIEQLRAAHP